MRKSTYTVHMEHPPERVSSFLANLCNDKKWRSEVVETQLVSGDAGSVGARYLETVVWEGLHAPADLSVTRLEQGRRLTVVAEDADYLATYEYEFDPAAGGTGLRLTSRIEKRGVLQLVEPFLTAIVTRWIQRGLDGLDSVLRQSPE